MTFDMERSDGLTGYMLALEGVEDSITIIHGPTGCKLYPSDLSERLYGRRNGTIETKNTFSRDQKYYFYQPRMPCTFLDGKRLIMGASERLNDLYSMAVDERPGLIGIINSPGASLTGEDLSKEVSDIPTVRVDSPEYSIPFQEGYQNCAIDILEALCRSSGKKVGSVNIFGISIWDVRFRDTISEFKRILSLCDIDVNCVLCAGSDTSHIADIPSSALNIVINEDFGLRIAEYCKDRFGTPYISRMPIGFTGTEEWIKDVCRAMNKDPSKALDDLRYWRKRTSSSVSDLVKRYVEIRGRTFSVHSTPMFSKELSEFLYDYLGMIPSAIQTDSGPEKDYDIGLPVEDTVWDTDVDVIYGSGSEIKSMVSRGLAAGGVEICEPTCNKVRIVNRPILGTMGSVFLIEDTLNILSNAADRL